jgi:uncharacterized protein related to proFAR isomerase
VHAIAGRRKYYNDVPFCQGSAKRLAKHYQTLGIERLYVADLDAIEGQAIQASTLSELLCLGWKQVLIDVGWRGDEAIGRRQKLAEIAALGSEVCWIAATESCRSTQALERLADCVSPHGVMLGLDYRQQTLIAHGSDQATSPDEGDWIRAASATETCCGAVVLEISAVGTRSGPSTLETCRRLHAIAPRLTLISGGGIRSSEDARELLRAGCTAVLAATSLFPGAGLLRENMH